MNMMNVKGNTKMIKELKSISTAAGILAIILLIGEAAYHLQNLYERKKHERRDKTDRDK